MKGRTNPRQRLLVSKTGVESLLELPAKIQRQAVRKMQSIEAAPASAGYPLRRELSGFRAIHSGRYRIIWQVATLEDGQEAAVVEYVGIRSEGDERDAYAEFARLFGLPGL